ncbi:response regulator transcription factor [Caenimonas sedimenti]|uniref:Response regulator transcription factor n=1 Tax=Caenimonas sedimenti TaxID=2596921 RepID=A0A562ZVX7_9BURK|nr:response regulator transcription factor [Caenimonas sedimenti]
MVDDHELVRLGLRALLHARFAPTHTQLHVFEVRSLTSAMEVYGLNRDSIALVFLDLNLPDSDGLPGLAQFMRKFPKARVAVLSGMSDPATVDQAISLGADAFLRKSADLDDVIAYLESRGVFPTQAAVPAAPRNEATPMAGLTQRQVQVLGLVLQGKSNREIADASELTEGTVKNHVSTILLHFGAKSRSQLISALRQQEAAAAGARAQ